VLKWRASWVRVPVMRSWRKMAPAGATATPTASGRSAHGTGGARSGGGEAVARIGVSAATATQLPGQQQSTHRQHRPRFRFGDCGHCEQSQVASLLRRKTLDGQLVDTGGEIREREAVRELL